MGREDVIFGCTGRRERIVERGSGVLNISYIDLGDDHAFYPTPLLAFDISWCLQFLHYQGSLSWTPSLPSSFFFFGGSHPRHMEIPRLGVELELQLLAMPQPQ